MIDAGPTVLEQRLLILAPVGKDGALTAAKLADAGLPGVVCSSLAGLAREVARGAAGVLVAEEALASGTGRLVETLARQPVWSDLPILVITRPGADSGTVALALRTLGNVILLERPIRVSTLISAARTALRARLRQYESRAQLQSLEEADRRKDEFLATLAHELRNPLAPIRNSVELLRLVGDGLPKARKLADMMGRQVSHMVRLVDDLLEISRITRGAIELRRSRVQLSAVIAAAIETSRPVIDAAGHQFEVTLAHEPIWLDADPTRLAQVFSNLLNNAAKYTDHGGRIWLDAERSGQEVLVRVRDSGIGIAGSLLPRVFDMFAQGESATTRAPGGLGIGLTLVRSLVEMHGGEVAAHSEGAGKGTILTVRLPVLGPPASEPENQSAPEEGSKPGHAFGPGQTTEAGDAPMIGHTTPDEGSAYAGQVPACASLPRVLVVDDNQDAADSLGALLEILGAHVVVAHDGVTALKMLEAHRQDLVFLDIGMPHLDGYEVARRIRKLPHGTSTFLVALTGWGQEKDRLRSEKAGFDRHLVKPASRQALESILQAVGTGPDAINSQG